MTRRWTAPGSSRARCGGVHSRGGRIDSVEPTIVATAIELLPSLFAEHHVDGSFGFQPDTFERGVPLAGSEALVGPNSGGLVLRCLPHCIDLFRLRRTEAGLFSGAVHLLIGVVLRHL